MSSHSQATESFPNHETTVPASPPPSPTGSNGAQDSRDARGRFAKGNAGGMGNPFARQVAALRQAALASITLDAVGAILAKMVELALTGDVPAAKLVLAYAIGRPATAPDPDRLDVEEWNHFKEAAPMLSEAESLLTPEPAVLLESVRRGRQARTWDYADLLATALRAPERPLPSLRDGADRGPKDRDPTATRHRRR